MSSFLVVGYAYSSCFVPVGQSGVQSENFLFLKQAILGGVGLGLLPLYAVRDELDTCPLIAVLPEYAPEGFGNKLYMITAPNLYQTQALRTLIEFLKARVLIMSKK